MDIFEFAMEKEKLAEDYYRRLRLKTSNKGLGNILTMLADEERKHFDLVQQMRQNAPQAMADTDVLGNAGAIFRKMRESAESFSVEVTELQLYEKAREIEKQARQFYLEKAEAVTDASHKEIFKKLANEEQKHFILLDSICDFVARPQWFLENAEMYRFDDYVDDAL
ncbi:MAG: rubrerythrin [Planctomycetes bacterium B3_Pla]|nr:MAG: rubrerythrin [Planctomycetes bacterium B3_Pla]